jgi:hypothetical protein
VPGGVAAAGSYHKKLFQLRESIRLLAGCVLEYAVGDLGAGEKPTGAPAQEGFDKTKIKHFLITGGILFLVHHGLLYRKREWKFIVIK